MDGIAQTSESVRSFPEFFVVLYHERSLSSPSDQSPRLLFFDWDGKPLMDISMKCQATSFDIDLHRNKLYISDQGTGAVSVADISELLSKIGE